MDKLKGIILTAIIAVFGVFFLEASCLPAQGQKVFTLYYTGNTLGYVTPCPS